MKITDTLRKTARGAFEPWWENEGWRRGVAVAGAGGRRRRGRLEVWQNCHDEDDDANEHEGHGDDVGFWSSLLSIACWPWFLCVAGWCSTTLNSM